MAVEAKISGNLNKFYKDVREDVRGLIGGAKVDAAVIFNNTQENVTFYVYNYIDVLYAVSAMKPLCAPGQYVTVAASGAQFKIHPNDKTAHQFLVAPFKGYVYNGPGAVEEVK